MSPFHRFVPLKGLLRHVIARDRLHVSALANTLQPPIDGKTAARVFKDSKPLAKTYRIAVLPFLAERVGVNKDALEAFEADPLSESHRELLCRAVGETAGSESAACAKLMTRSAAIRHAARSVLRFERHLPEDLCFPQEEPVEFDCPRQWLFVLHSAFGSSAPQNGHQGAGNQADRDEPIENLIDQVELGNVSLGIANDHAASWQPSSLGVLGALDGLELFDDSVLVFRWRDGNTISLVQADENEAAKYVIRSSRESVERLGGFLAHAPGPLPATAFLETMLSPATWRRTRRTA